MRTAAPEGAAPADPTSEGLTLQQAAHRYDITARTLAQHIRCGQLPAYKTRGATGRQWRVTERELQAAGYRLRRATPTGPSDDPTVAQLRRELALAWRSADAERRRADDLDRRLGHALLQCGQLRTALAAATGEHQPTEPDLEPASCAWLLDTVRGDIGRQRSARAAEP